MKSNFATGSFYFMQGHPTVSKMYKYLKWGFQIFT